MDLHNLDSLDVSLYDKDKINESENSDISSFHRRHKPIDLDKNLISIKINPEEESKSTKFLNVSTNKNVKLDTFESKILSSKKIVKNNKNEGFTLSDKKEMRSPSIKFYKNKLNDGDFNFKKEKNGKEIKNEIEENNGNKPTMKQKLTLSDLEMYYKFGIFPYIFFIHLLIIVLTTYIVSNFFIV